MSTGVRSRIVPLLACVLVVAAGLVVRTSSSSWSDKVGDLLYAALVVLGLWALRPTARPRWLAVPAAAWCLGVELLQLTTVPTAAARAVPVSRLVLGSGFDAVDLVAYAVGVTLAVGGVALVSRRGGPGVRPPH